MDVRDLWFTRPSAEMSEAEREYRHRQIGAALEPLRRFLEAGEAAEPLRRFLEAGEAAKRRSEPMQKGVTHMTERARVKIRRLQMELADRDAKHAREIAELKARHAQEIADLKTHYADVMETKKLDMMREILDWKMKYERASGGEMESRIKGLERDVEYLEEKLRDALEEKERMRAALIDAHTVWDNRANVVMSNVANAVGSLLERALPYRVYDDEKEDGVKVNG